MKKGIIVGIVIAIIIGVSALAVSQDNSDDTSEIFLDENVEIDSSEISLSEDVEREPKSFTVDLEESVGFSEKP